MSTQPKALLLAAALEAQDLYHDREAAAELRRLHELNAELMKALKLSVGTLDDIARAAGLGVT